jgi:hypothetical protein
MCQTLAQLRQAAASLAAGFDPGLVAPHQLAHVLRDAGAIEKMMGTVATLTAARMAAGGAAASAARRAVRDLAHASGTSLFEASRALEASKQLAAQPEVAAAARAGELSRPQLALVAGAVAVNAGAAPRLLGVAQTGSLQDLSDEAARARAVGQDLEARRRAVHLARSLRHYTDTSGTWHLHAHGTPEQGAQVLAALAPFTEKAFQSGRKQGQQERPEAYAFDGLVGLATAGGSKAPRPGVLYRVDYAVMVRGYPLDGEVCEIAGVGPVSRQAVLDVMDCGDPILRAVVTKGKDVMGVAHLGRRPNAHQQTALDWMFPSCAAEGCGTRAAYLETDHRIEWSQSHVTVLDMLDRLCKFHHRLKTYEGWALVHGRGKRALVPPDDARHPRHSHIESRQ